MTDVTAASFGDEVLRAPGPVLVDFWAPWCGPCRALAPMLEQIAREHPGLRVVKVNIDEEPALAERYGVLSIPAVIRFDGGEPSRTFTGLRPKQLLVRALGL